MVFAEVLSFGHKSSAECRHTILRQMLLGFCTNCRGADRILHKIGRGCQYSAPKLVVLADVFLDIVGILVLLTRQSLQRSSFKATSLR